MGGLPFMPLYVDDYEAATAHLSPLEDGIYMRLLRLLWRSPGCSIPDNQQWIMRHLRVESAVYVEVVHPIILEFFTRKNGKIFQRRLMAEWQRTNQKIEARKTAGKLGGAAKALKEKELMAGNAKRLSYHPEPYPDNKITTDLSLAAREEDSVSENIEIHPSVAAALARQKARKW
jgi:uncharacterized protein YdaU (DUF1376 family)